MCTWNSGVANQIADSLKQSYMVSSSATSGIRPSWTATLLYADLHPLRHITADLSRENDSRHLSQPMMTLYGSSRFMGRSEANLLYVTVAALPIPPDVLNTRGWRSLAQPHEHAVRMLDTSLLHVFCSKHPSGCLGMTVHMGWTPLHQKMHSAVAVPRIHMLSRLIGLSPLCWLWQVISVLLWAVGGQVQHSHHAIPLTSNLLWDLKPHCDVWYDFTLDSCRCVITAWMLQLY